MKKAIFLLAAALLLPISQAWADSYYATLLAKVSNASSGRGKVYADTSSDAPGASSFTDGTSTAPSQSAMSSKTYTFYAHALANDNYEFDYWSETDGGSSVSTDNPYKVEVSATSTSSSSPSSKTVFANFKEKQLTAFSVTFVQPSNGSYTVDGAGGYGTKGPYNTVYTPTLVATANSGYAFNGWYLTSDGGQTKGTLLSMATTYKGSFATTQSVMAEFVESVTVTTYEELTTELARAVCIEIPSSATIFIESGKSLSVAANQTLIVNGALYVIGSFANSGTVKGGGAVVKVTKKITQTGKDDIGTPITTDCADTSKNKKYYKTAAESVTASVSGTMSAAQKNGAIVMRGGSRIAQCAWPTTDTPAVLSCTIDATKAVNHITGFNETCYYTSSADDLGAALLLAKANPATKMLLLLSDTEISSAVINRDGLKYYDGKTKFNADVGVMDLAGKKLTVNTGYINSYSHVVLNGSYRVSTLMYSGTITCINLAHTKSGSTVNPFFASIKPDYASTINVYDCASAKIANKYEDSSTIKNTFNILSSAADIAYKTSDFLSRTGAYHIYGGRWEAEPDKTFIGGTLSTTHKFYQHDDGKWYLEEKLNKEVATLDDGTLCYDMAEAFAAIATAFNTRNSVKLTMERDATAGSSITVPVGKTLEIELNRCCITAANGFAVNNGTLVLGDNNANLKGTEGGRVLTTSGNLLVNNGTADVTYGYYTGNVVLNGGTFTTHHGRFTGSVTGDKAYANLVGGYFDNDVSALLKAGVIRKNGYVGPFPKPSITKEWVASSGGYWKFSFKTLPAADLALYNNSSNQKSDYSLADWKRRAEVKSSVTPWADSGFMVDILTSFDRNIKSGTATAQITKPYSMLQDIAGDVNANELYRILSAYMISQSASQKKYTAFLSDSTFQNVIYGFSSTTAANYGTTANLRIDLCNGTDTSVNSVQALMSEYVVFGAGSSNQAMIQPASGQATFYATVAAAVDACPRGGTVKLCNDIAATDTITISKSCTIDVNGMVFNGTFAPGTGFTMSVSVTVPTVEQYLGKNHKVYTFTPIPYTITYELNGGTNHKDNPATYTVESAAVTLKAPTRAGHFFTGWAEGGTIPAGSTGAKTFTATWKKSTVFYVK